jgi:Tol biopolymer transport system component
VVAEGVTRGTVISASQTGSIAYRTPPADSGQRQFVWLDRSGRETQKVVYGDTAALGPSLSSDHRRIAVYRDADGNMDIWWYEIDRRAWERVTFDPGDDIYPLWSPDGASVAFGAVRAASGRVDLYRRVLGAPPGVEELLLTTPEGKFPTDWSSDGRFILYDSIDMKTGPDLFALPLDGAKTPIEILRTEFNESQAQFSPDGKWIAYQSDRTGRNEIYLRRFPVSGEDRRVSIDGGTQPRWNGRGDELFFIGGDDRLMAVSMGVPAGSQVLEPGVPAGLFHTSVGSTVTLNYRQQYMVAADGQSFVINSSVADGTASPISVILNWKPRRP